MRRREFIAGLGSAATWPMAAQAQQGDRVRRVGVLLPDDETSPVYPVPKTQFSTFTQALAGLGWTFVGAAMTSIGCERSRRSWSACTPTSSGGASTRAVQRETRTIPNRHFKALLFG
jgi:hypothetical protein